MKNVKINVILTLFLIVVFYNFSLVASSEGDNSPYYISCLENCKKKNCTKNDPKEFTPKAAQMQDLWAWLLQWNCVDECRYQCMFRTVRAYEERNYRVPKFHGKWPFLRILGIQEPASMLTSAMNLASHTYMYRQLVKDRRFSVRTMPVMIFWHLFYAVCAHGWIWSILFHMRDTSTTEFMDYACALSMVMMYFASAIVRLFHHRRKAGAVILLSMLVFYVKYVRKLYLENIDYQYNMTVNVVCGTLATALWLVYALGALCGASAKGQLEQRYVWRLVVFCKLTGASVLLELFDFPPYMRIWDAHALWHLCTSPLPLFFYRFAIDDLNYLRMYSYRALDKKLA